MQARQELARGAVAPGGQPSTRGQLALLRLVGLPLGLGLLFVLAAAGTGRADEAAPAVTVAIRGEVDLLPEGDGRVRVDLEFPADAYEGVKREGQDKRRFLRAFASHRTDAELVDADVQLLDEQHTVRLEITERGGVKNAGGGRWRLAMDPGPRFLDLGEEDGRVIARFAEEGVWDSGVAYQGVTRYHLPAGAVGAGFDAASRVLSWTLPRSPASGPADLELDLRVKPRLMTAIYKVYGLGTTFSAQWVAKAIFRHRGGGDVRDLRARFRLAGYGEWGMWQKVKELIPGQTVVLPWYPVLEERIAHLTSNTPANVMVEWTWRDADGQRHEDSDGARIVLLGAHEFVFSDVQPEEHLGTWHESFNNVPFLAAWVSRDDLVVKQFAALANRKAGGIGANQSNQATVQVLRGIYDLLVDNDFTYQHPPALPDRSVSFDVQQVQNVKFPRDVIRDRSGTCLDLAILQAACASNLGIPAYLAVVPGHCFPVFGLPDGDVVAVEATGIRGGLRPEVVPFEEAVSLGLQQLQHWRGDGRILIVNVRELWTQGVSNPELPALQADILTRWGIEAGPPGGSVAPARPRARAPDAESLVGTWEGEIRETAQDGSPFTYPLVLVAKLRSDGRLAVGLDAQAVVPDGQDGIRVSINEAFVLQPEGDAWRGRGTAKRLEVNGTVRESAMDEMELKLDGRTLVGRYGNDEGITPFRLEAAAPPAPELTGVWTGTTEEELDGTRFSYPLRLEITPEGDGWQARLVITATVPTRPAPRRVEVEEIFAVVQEGEQLKGRTVRKTMRVEGREVPTVKGTLTLRLEGEALVGRFGSEQQGYTDFQLERDRAPSFAGTWEGQVTDTLADGTRLTYPLLITIEPRAGGGFTVSALARARMPADGRQIEVEAAWEGLGRLDGSVLAVQGTKKTYRVGGEQRSDPPDDTTMRIEDGRLVGRLGNDEDGYTDFRLDRRR
ncbi:MAG: hypothetical protein AB7T63_04535 [Planctomycetota bacterium]